MSDSISSRRIIETDKRDLDRQIDDLEQSIDGFHHDAQAILKKLKAERDHLYGEVGKALDGFENAENELVEAGEDRE